MALIELKGRTVITGGWERKNGGREGEKEAGEWREN
jgi:hypothetical protein